MSGTGGERMGTSECCRILYPLEALKWISMAAEQWDSIALGYLGDYYSGMWGGEVNRENAIRYYEKAVAVANWSPCTHALEKLADCYKRGWLDADEADEWLDDTGACWYWGCDKRAA